MIKCFITDRAVGPLNICMISGKYGIKHFAFGFTVIDLFSALCAKLFQRGRQLFEVFFFLLSAHFNRLLYIEGIEFKG